MEAPCADPGALWLLSPQLTSAYLVDGFLLMAGALGDWAVAGNWSDPAGERCFRPGEDPAPWSEGPSVRRLLLQVRVYRGWGAGQRGEG